MSDHDPLCPVAMFGDRHPKTSAWCHCALIARVRADEREREREAIRPVLERAMDALSRHDTNCGHFVEAAALAAQVIHAEAVAAKLVEVICEDETFRRNATWEFGVVYGQLAAVEAERDAARAEVERLGEIVREQDEHAAWMRQCWKAVAEERDEARADAIVATRERDARVRADERERIAQAIEEFHAAECGPPESPWPHVCTCVTAAAIARGEVLL